MWIIHKASGIISSDDSIYFIMILERGDKDGKCCVPCREDGFPGNLEMDRYDISTPRDDVVISGRVLCLWKGEGCGQGLFRLIYINLFDDLIGAARL